MLNGSSQVRNSHCAQWISAISVQIINMIGTSQRDERALCCIDDEATVWYSAKRAVGERNLTRRECWDHSDFARQRKLNVFRLHSIDPRMRARGRGESARRQPVNRPAFQRFLTRLMHAATLACTRHQRALRTRVMIARKDWRARFLL